MIINEDGKPFKLCGQKGCLSCYVSGAAFKEVYGVSPFRCEDKEVWTDYAKKLSLGIVNVIAMWGPDVLVLGGSISNKFEGYFKEPLLDEHFRPRGPRQVAELVMGTFCEQHMHFF